MSKAGKIALAVAMLVPAGLVLFFVWMLAGATEETASAVTTWQLLQERGIQVPAHVTSMRTVRIDSEGADDTDYDLYVSYEVDGKTYTDRYWKRVDDKPVGSTAVTIVVDPVRPHVIQPQAEDVQSVVFPFFVWLVGSFAAAGFSCLLAGALRNKKEWPRFYGDRPLTCAVVQEEIDWAQSYRRRVFRIHAAVVVLLTAGYLLLRSKEPYGSVLNVIMGIPVALGLMIMAVYLMVQRSRSVVADVRLTRVLGVAKDSEGTVTGWALDGCKPWAYRGDRMVCLGGSHFNMKDAPDEVLVAVDSKDRVLRLFCVEEFSLPEM